MNNEPSNQNTNLSQLPIPYDVISFDAYGTLFDARTAILPILQEFITRYRLNATPENLMVLWDIYSAELHPDFFTLSEICWYCFRRIQQHFEIRGEHESNTAFTNTVDNSQTDNPPEYAYDASRAWLKALASAVLYPEAREVLDTLMQQGIVLVIASNIDNHEIRECMKLNRLKWYIGPGEERWLARSMLKNTGTDKKISKETAGGCEGGYKSLDYKKSDFTMVITSESARAYKPDKPFFEYLVSCINTILAPAIGIQGKKLRILHIGDDPVADSWGATQAGIPNILIQRKHKISSASDERVKEIKPIAVVPSLAEVLQVLRN